MKLEYGTDMVPDYSWLKEREWLLTNGLGGYSSSTISDAHTRRYHSLLVAALEPPGRRVATLSKLEMELYIDEHVFRLSTNRYRGAIHPEGYTFLRAFEFDGDRVMHTFAGSLFELVRTVEMVKGENCVRVILELKRAARPVSVKLVPLVAMRDHHRLRRASEREAPVLFCQSSGNIVLRDEGAGAGLIMTASSLNFYPYSCWYYNFFYEAESERGLDAEEDLFSPGAWFGPVNEGKPLIIEAEVRPAGQEHMKVSRNRPPANQTGVRTAVNENGNGKKDVEAHEKTSKLSDAANSNLPPYIARLRKIADSFIVRRNSTNALTIIAGYHWFLDWGRDAMISIPGLLLATGRIAQARSVFKTFIENIEDGLIPNAFEDGAPDKKIYNSVDASLWFINAAYRYLNLEPRERQLDFPAGEEFETRLILTSLEIIEKYYNGTKFGIHADVDGLISCSAEGIQLTWMDAKVGDWVVTERRGKPVEVNALWYNALMAVSWMLSEEAGMCFYPCLASRLSQDSRKEKILWLKELSQRVRDSFNRLFVREGLDHLVDFVSPDGEKCLQLRPNMLFAVSLPFSPLCSERAVMVVKEAREKLLTPKGLRSLASDDKEYKGHYTGNIVERDGAYHQGTVWPYLIGPFLSAFLRVNNYHPDALMEASRILEGVAGEGLEYGLLTVPELAEGDPPHSPKGAISQAWSVAEILRIYFDEISGRFRLSPLL